MPPNREAVELIKHIASQLRQDPGIFFVIAGSCAGPQNFGENLLSLGPVSEDELNRLYALSEVALAPITSGSGSSLKVLEALRHRVVLLSTDFGVRGHAIRSGQHAILCDDFSAYPDILRGLRSDAAGRARMAEAGWRFVQAFDFKTVYQEYVTLIHRLLAATP